MYFFPLRVSLLQTIWLSLKLRYVQLDWKEALLTQSRFPFPDDSIAFRCDCLSWYSRMHSSVKMKFGMKDNTKQ
jgi:hypothetical protein